MRALTFVASAGSRASQKPALLSGIARDRIGSEVLPPKISLSILHIAF